MGLRVLVLGGTGFIGRHAALALHTAGAEVTIGSRHPSRHADRYPFATFCQVKFEQLVLPQAWAHLTAGADVVVNCVGILRQRPGESYDDVHHRAPSALALACAESGVRLVHTSALGLHEDARSRFLSSKLRGEAAIRASGCDYSIVRPSLLDGEGGFGASWLRGLSRWPVHFVPRGARGGIAAMTASDLGHAFARLASFPSLSPYREVELGGVHPYSYGEYLQKLRNEYRTSPALQLPLPNWVARLGAHLCDAAHFSPFSYGHWILLQRDNVPRPNRLPELLGRDPAAIGVGWPRVLTASTGKITAHDLPDTTTSRSP